MNFDIALVIDHTQLKPEATPAHIKLLCEEAETHRFASVCVNPSYVKLAAQYLRDGDVNICTVIGFPLGATTADVKISEAMRAMVQGANELNMVIHIGRLKAGDHPYVKQEIFHLAELAHKSNVILKVIIETGVLTNEEKIIVCKLAQEAGADFVKTSTGYRGGATVLDVRLIRGVVGPDMGIEASSGISTYDAAMEMIRAGATRIGTSSGIAIVGGAPSSVEVTK